MFPSPRKPLPGPYAVLVVPESDFSLCRQDGACPLVLPCPGRCTLRSVAHATLEHDDVHAQLSAALWAMSDTDRLAVAKRLREFADFLEEQVG